MTSRHNNQTEKGGSTIKKSSTIKKMSYQVERSAYTISVNFKYSQSEALQPAKEHKFTTWRAAKERDEGTPANETTTKCCPSKRKMMLDGNSYASRKFTKIEKQIIVCNLLLFNKKYSFKIIPTTMENEQGVINLMSDSEEEEKKSEDDSVKIVQVAVKVESSQSEEDSVQFVKVQASQSDGSSVEVVEDDSVKVVEKPKGPTTPKQKLAAAPSVTVSTKKRAAHSSPQTIPDRPSATPGVPTEAVCPNHTATKETSGEEHTKLPWKRTPAEQEAARKEHHAKKKTLRERAARRKKNEPKERNKNKLPRTETTRRRTKTVMTWRSKTANLLPKARNNPKLLPKKGRLALRW